LQSRKRNEWTEKIMRIPCPWCGDRDLTEFRCGGQADRVRPQLPEETSDEQWADYLFYRDNSKGPHHERWVHAWGCRQWFNVIRDTTTHDILGTYQMGETPPAPGNPPSPGPDPFQTKDSPA